jgi:hypothetical protein
MMNRVRQSRSLFRTTRQTEQNPRTPTSMMTCFVTDLLDRQTKKGRSAILLSVRDRKKRFRSMEGYRNL